MSTYLSTSLKGVLVGLIAVLGAAALAPQQVQAETTYHYTCDDLTSGDSPDCTDGVWSKASPFSLLDATAERPLAAGTWYITAFVETADNSPFRITCYEYSSGTCNTYNTLVEGQNDNVTFTINSGTSNGIYLWGQSASDIAISEICVTDTLGACAEGGGGEVPSNAILVTPQFIDTDRVTVSTLPLSFNGISVGIASTTDILTDDFGTVSQCVDEGGDLRTSNDCAGGSSYDGETHYFVKNGILDLSYYRYDAENDNDDTYFYVALGRECPGSGPCSSLTYQFYYFGVHQIDNHNFELFTSGDTYGTFIDAVIPEPDSTIATSSTTTISVSGGIASGDYVSGETEVYVRWRQITGMGVRDNGPIAAWGEHFLPATTTGAFITSTTTSMLKSGEYTAFAVIQVPRFSAFGFNLGHVYLTEPVYWRFTVGTSTDREKDQVKLLMDTTGIGSTATASSTVTAYITDIETCSVFDNFSLTECLSFLFTPSPEAIAQMQSQVTSILEKWPWGYATRAMSLMSGNATSTAFEGISTDLPTLNVDLKTTYLPGVAGVSSVDLTPWDKLMSTSSVLGSATSPKDGKTFREIVEPYWNFLVVFMFAMVLLMRLLGVNIAGGVETQMRNADYAARKPRL